MFLAQPAINVEVEVKKWVEPIIVQTPIRTFLNCQSDISSRLLKVKYCTDQYRLKAFYRKKTCEKLF